jgi:hypothetical protein
MSETKTATCRHNEPHDFPLSNETHGSPTSRAGEHTQHITVMGNGRTHRAAALSRGRESRL